MLRLTFTLAVLAPIASVAAESEFDAMLSKLQSLPDPFSAPAAAVNTSGLQTVYAQLANVGGVVFTGEGSGSLTHAGLPWRTGETRMLGSGSAKIQVRLERMTPADGTRAASASFFVGDQELSVDLPTMDVPQAPVSLTGWIVSPSLVVTKEAAPSGSFPVQTPAGEVRGEVVARSSAQGLTLIRLSAPAGAGIRHSTTKSTTAILLAPNRARVRVPVSILQEPAPEELVGALILDDDGALLGVLGRAGAIPASSFPANEKADCVTAGSGPIAMLPAR